MDVILPVHQLVSKLTHWYNAENWYNWYITNMVMLYWYITNSILSMVLPIGIIGIMPKILSADKCIRNGGIKS